MTYSDDIGEYPTDSDAQAKLADYHRRIGFLIRRVDQLATHLFTKHCDDITGSQYGILYALSLCKAADQKTLSRLVWLDQATTGYVIGILQRKGYIIRQRDSKDRRHMTIQLSPSARRAIPAISTAAEKMQAELVQNLSKPEVAQLQRLLAKLLAYKDT